jgi:uncharacterized membrane protein
MRFYDYIFFKAYQIGFAFDDSPAFGTVIVLCWLFLFNLFTLSEYVLEDLGLSPFSNLYLTILVCILILAGHFYLFYYKKRYLAIHDRFKDESKALRIVGTIGVIAYVFLTIYVTFKYTVPHVEWTRGS